MNNYGAIIILSFLIFLILFSTIWFIVEDVKINKKNKEQIEKNKNNLRSYRMNREAFIRILRTLEIYATDEFDGVYQSVVVLDKLVDELKKAIHCNECCSASEG